MNPLAALKFPMVTKQVREFLVVSFPDLEITVSESVLTSQSVNKDYVVLMNRLQARAINLAMEKLSRLDEIKKKHYRPPSYIKQTIQLEKKESVSTKVAAQYLGISERTLRRWELAGRIQASKTFGGHRQFEAGSLLKLKDLMTTGVKPPTPHEQEFETLKVNLEKSFGPKASSL